MGITIYKMSKLVKQMSQSEKKRLQKEKKWVGHVKDGVWYPTKGEASSGGAKKGQASKKPAGPKGLTATLVMEEALRGAKIIMPLVSTESFVYKEGEVRRVAAEMKVTSAGFTAELPLLPARTTLRWTFALAQGTVEEARLTASNIKALDGSVQVNGVPSGRVALRMPKQPVTLDSAWSLVGLVEVVVDDEDHASIVDADDSLKLSAGFSFAGQAALAISHSTL